MNDYVIKRGYVKWTDEDGVFHKEPLYDHPDLLAEADPAEQLYAEEARRLNESAEPKDEEEDKEQATWDALHALQGAPEHVLTTNQLVAVQVDGEELIVPSDEVESALPDDTQSDDELVLSTNKKLESDLWSENHDEALNQLRRETSNN